MADDWQVRQVHELDVRKARKGIRAVCERASSNWIPKNAIADALLLEYVDYATDPHMVQQLKLLLSVLKGKQRIELLQ